MLQALHEKKSRYSFRIILLGESSAILRRFVLNNRQGVKEMTNCGMRLHGRGNSVVVRYALFLIAASALLMTSSQMACSKKGKVPAPDVGPVRVVLLPFKVPEGNKDFQWAALAPPVLLARIGEQFPDLVIVPFWEVMPTAIASAGASRSFDDESAGSVASWVGAKWAILGEIEPYKKGFSVAIDFIPAKSTEVPFRYIKTRRMETMGPAFNTAIRQFLRYVMGKPFPPSRKNVPGLNKMKPLAEALDKEYGWFAEADPGKAQDVIEDMPPEDKKLARILFNSTMYPNLAN